MKALKRLFTLKPTDRSWITCEHCGRDEASMLPAECYGVCNCGRIFRSSFPQVQLAPAFV